MKTRFSFIDPGAIMGVVVSLIILAVGVFAFFVTISNIPGSQLSSNMVNGSTTVWGNMTDAQRTIYNTTQNVTGTGNGVFNIIGIVLIIGAIMSIVGLVYNYVR